MRSGAWRLEGDGGAVCRLLDYGATLQQLLIPDAAGELADVVLGYDSIAGYESADNGYHEDDHRQTWQSY